MHGRDALEVWPRKRPNERPALRVRATGRAELRGVPRADLGAVRRGRRELEVELAGVELLERRLGDVADLEGRDRVARHRRRGLHRSALLPYARRHDRVTAPLE